MSIRTANLKSQGHEIMYPGSMSPIRRNYYELTLTAPSFPPFFMIFFRKVSLFIAYDIEL